MELLNSSDPIKELLERLEKTQKDGHRAFDKAMRQAWVFMFVGFMFSMFNIIIYFLTHAKG